jgi:cell division protein FtsB
MPWSASDAKKHKKGLNKQQAQKWATIANSVLEQCLKNGGKQKACESKAIKVANSKVGNNNQSEEEVSGVKTKKLKIPKKALCFSEDVDIQLSEADEDGNRYFSMKAYSGKPIKDYLYWGDLVIDVAGVKCTQKRIPILEQHRIDQKIGVSNTPPSFDKNQINFEKIKVLKNDAATEFAQNLDEGFPYQASISIRPIKIEELAEGAKAEVNGYKIKGPAQILRESVLREASVCVFGADPNTSVASLSDETEEFEVELTEKEEEDFDDNIEETGGKSMTLKELKEKFPELFKQIQDDATNALSEENKTLKEENTNLKQKVDDLEKEKKDLTEKDKENEKRIAKLEAAEEIRKQKDMAAEAASIVDVKLAASDIPERLYHRIKKQIDFNEYVKEDALDVENFSAFVDEEVKAWADELSAEFTQKKKKTVLGLSDSTHHEDKNQEYEDLSDELVSLAGVMTEKKE